MSLYIYAPVLQPGTKELIELLQAKRLRKHDGMHFLHKGTPIDFSPVDVIVCWGSHVPAPNKVNGLNCSLSYNSLLGLNVRGLAELNKLGYVVLIPSPLRQEDYQAGLCKGDWPSRAPKSGYVSLPEFEGYGTNYYKFEVRDDVAVFRGEVLNQVQSILLRDVAIGAAKHLGLDFGVFSCGLVNGTPVLYKIQTAPALDDKGLKLFSKRIAAWAKSVGEFNATAGKYEELLR
jgi:hypothetical protein